MTPKVEPEKFIIEDYLLWEINRGLLIMNGAPFIDLPSKAVTHLKDSH